LKELEDIFARERNESKPGDVPLYPDEEILKVLHSNTRAQQLASLLMLSAPLSMDHEPHVLVHKLQRLWPQLLQLPIHDGNRKYSYEMALIVPV
jgi:hypothetical protein